MKSLLPLELQQNISGQKAVKIITGLNNFSLHSIIRIIKAAELGQASYIDIAANAEILSIVKSITNFPVCVSSIEPLELADCAMKGADIVELGNFDVFYNKKVSFSFEQILNLARETKDLIPDTPICVTIPHTLLLSQQINLAILLKKIGISIIQTEGYSTKKNISQYIQVSSIVSSINSASSAISSTYAMSQYSDIPIITASGINCLSAPAALSYGASIVGIGSVLSNYSSITDMSTYIYEIVSSMKSSFKASIISPHLFNIRDIYAMTYAVI